MPTASLGIIFKDAIYTNASIGKKILHLEIRDNIGNIPKKYKIILRNISLLLWPIELIFLLILNRRIGDIIFNTKVIYKNDKINRVDNN